MVEDFKINRRGFLKAIAAAAASGPANINHKEPTPPPVIKKESIPKDLLSRCNKMLDDYEASNRLPLDIETLLIEAKNKLSKIELKEVSKDMLIAYKAVDGNIKIITAPLFKNQTKSQSHTKDGVTIEVVGDKDIGVSQRFVIKENGINCEMLAVKRSSYIRTSNKYNPIPSIYIPAETNIGQQETVERYGKEYLTFCVDKAMDVCQESLKDSTYFKEMFQEQEMNVIKGVIKSLFVTEHLEPVKFYDNRNNKQMVEYLFKNIYREIGYNTRNSFAHYLNSSGAGGISQMTEGTFDNIVKKLKSSDINANNNIVADFAKKIQNRESSLGNPIIAAILAIIYVYDCYKVISGLVKNNKMHVTNAQWRKKKDSKDTSEWFKSQLTGLATRIRAGQELSRNFKVLENYNIKLLSDYTPLLVSNYNGSLNLLMEILLDIYEKYDTNQVTNSNQLYHLLSLSENGGHQIITRNRKNIKIYENALYILKYMALNGITGEKVGLKPKDKNPTKSKIVNTKPKAKLQLNSNSKPKQIQRKQHR